MPPSRFPPKIFYVEEGHTAVSIPVAKTAWTLAAAGALTVAAHIAWWKYAPLSLRRAYKLPSSRRFQLLVEFQFKSSDEVEAFKEIWAELAEYVAKYEPQTLAYELIEADNQPHKLLVFERYTNKEALTEIHHKSAAFKSFSQKLSKLDLDSDSKSSQSYYETSLGYV